MGPRKDKRKKFAQYVGILKPASRIWKPYVDYEMNGFNCVVWMCKYFVITYVFVFRWVWWFIFTYYSWNFFWQFLGYWYGFFEFFLFFQSKSESHILCWDITSLRCKNLSVNTHFDSAVLVSSSQLASDRTQYFASKKQNNNRQTWEKKQEKKSREIVAHKKSTVKNQRCPFA